MKNMRLCLYDFVRFYYFWQFLNPSPATGFKPPCTDIEPDLGLFFNLNSMRFISKIFHPNIYPDGKVCISILHPPGDDPTGYEKSSERWSPVQSVEKVHTAKFNPIKRIYTLGKIDKLS